MRPVAALCFKWAIKHRTRRKTIVPAETPANTFHAFKPRFKWVSILNRLAKARTVSEFKRPFIAAEKRKF